MNNSKHVKKILSYGYTVIKDVLGKRECKKIKEICKKNYLRYTKLTKLKILVNKQFIIFTTRMIYF